jgi:sialate O-acetylesterase
MPAMIADWRAKFGADTPFFNTQLTSFGDIATKPQQSDWAELRDVQRRVTAETPNTGLAVTIDLGVHDNIHPASKQEVGRRLALLAETRVYGAKVEDSGPAPVSAMRTRNTVTLAFDHVARELSAHAWDHVIGFELCSNGNCGFVAGKIDKDHVVLDATASPRATTVRYCWADSPWCNLYNSEGLPAGPFEIAISGKKLNRTARHRDYRTARRAH